jgi:hypothetical protein
MTRIDDDSQQYPSDWDRDNLTRKKQELPMTERTIKKDELRTSLANLGITFNGINEIIEAAFPPIFKPKEGEAIIVSNYADFSHSRVRVFDCMNDDSQYECFDHGRTGGTNTASWGYAKPQTPTQKGE